MKETEETYIDPQGMVLVASSSEDPDRSKLGEVHDDIFLVSSSGKEAIATCGHKAQANLTFDVYGTELSSTDHHKCVDCAQQDLRNNVIRCALCGHAIVPGSPVAIYGLDTTAEYESVSHKPPGGGMLGCLAWDCCPSGGFYAGHWLGSEQGFRPADFGSGAENAQ